MKTVVVVVALFLLTASIWFFLSSFGGGKNGLLTDITHEKIDGIDCLVVRNSNSGYVRAIDCDWGSDG